MVTGLANTDLPIGVAMKKWHNWKLAINENQ